MTLPCRLNRILPTGVILALVYLYWQSLFSYFFTGIRKPVVVLGKVEKCQIPRLSPHNLISGINSSEPEPSCYRNATLLFKIDFENNLLRLDPNPSHWGNLWNQSKCYYSPVVRIPSQRDFRYEPETHGIEIQNPVTALGPTVDHIHLWCENASAKKIFYVDYMSTLQMKPELEEKLDAANAGKEFYSVLIIGQDSSSHMNFIRTMPKVQEFLKNKLDAVEFHGFNSLGPTMLWSTSPFLSGLELKDFTNTCYYYGSFKDSCPFIWKKFEDIGYRTAFDEDEAPNSIFRPVGPHPFKQQPFNYDFRAVANKFAYSTTSPRYCAGPRLSIQVLLDNMERVAKTFHDKPYWDMMWAQYLSHHENSLSKYAEPSMLSTLESLYEKKLLNNTILILMSDHGMWWRDFIEPSDSDQAFLEQRLPILYVVLPQKFKEKYPLATRNLRQNAEKLTTAFDVHEMMLDLLDLSELTHKRIEERAMESVNAMRRNVSLFLPINPHRTCAMAGISLVNCACLSRQSASVSEPSAVRAANFVVQEINDRIKAYKQCSNLVLQNITEVFLTSGAKESNMMGQVSFKFNRAAVVHSHGEYFEIGISTSPGRGKYYASVVSDGFDGHFTLDEIARVSIYGNDADCMPVRELKPYCYCK